jgi:DNA-binding transcriptional LysR family regulator
MKPILDMEIFVRVVDEGSLSAAGRHLRISAAVVSSRIARLEARLQTTLLNRSTRYLQATEEGLVYYEHCRRILEDIAQVESTLAARRQRPSGMLSVTAPSGFGRLHVAPLLPRLSAQYPDLSVHLHLTDQLVTFAEDGVDVAIRIGELRDSSLKVRKLAPNRRVICASPDYLARRGEPQRPADLLAHDCLLLRFPGSQQFQWSFETAEGLITIPVSGPLDSNNGEVLRGWALDGHGLVMKSLWEVGEDIAAGRLKPVLQGYALRESGIYAVFPNKRFFPSKVRVFIDFLLEQYSPIPPWGNSNGAVGDAE